MKKTARELFEMPMKHGELSDISTLQDVSGANMTVEQAVILKQMQSAMNGNTEAAMFLQQVIGEESDDCEDTAISDAAKSGDTLKMLEALRDKLSSLADKSTNLREVAAISRQLIDVNDRIDEIKKTQRNKQGENPLNVIRLNSVKKRKAVNL